MGLRNDWVGSASCRRGDPDALFVQGAAQRRAKVVCHGCPVRAECLADALDNRVEFGVWGGMTERERRALLRRRPDVRSWWRLLDAAARSQDEVDHPVTAAAVHAVTITVPAPRREPVDHPLSTVPVHLAATG
jgi:WhiB family redox-sensing transcriptional regulator